MIPIRRALLSVSDKSGVAQLAKVLHSHGCELISTGGTRKALEDEGLPVTEISRVTGNPEAFGGRMKTISFQIESALLFDRERDAEEAARLGIQPIDLVVCNLYPFAKHKDAGADLETLIENIDIGGPTMIRAAAKNYRFVVTVTDPSQYAAVISALKENHGKVPKELSAQLMRAAFNATADYDAMIAVALGERAGEPSLRLRYDKPVPMRYGENPHQKATFMREAGAANSLHDLQLHGGKELSFNNLTDLGAAVEAACALRRRGCAIIKHANPCGLSESDSQRDALERAWAADPVSAFGSVIAFNARVERTTIELLDLDHSDKSRRKFVEVVAAPEFDPGAIELLRANKNLRIVQFDPKALERTVEHRFLPGALLVQDVDRQLLEKLEPVTSRAPSADRALVEFAMIAARQVKSNAIAIARRSTDGTFQLLGMGAGQPNRVNSTRLAIDRARATLAAEQASEERVKEQLAQAVLASDAFFPFPDSIDIAAGAGIREIYQPGGSLRDNEVIARCNELGVAMAMTGTRHFKH